MKIFNKLLFMLLAVGMFSSCIKEDMDDCPKYSVNTLSLSYKGDGTAEIFNVEDRARCDVCFRQERTTCNNERAN